LLCSSRVESSRAAFTYSPSKLITPPNTLIMTIVQVEDTRNVEWRANNKGSALLQKMGWTEGKGIGKRNANTTALRAVKRQEGLGLGAKLQTEGGQSESTNTFAEVLKNLQQHHGSRSETGSVSSPGKKDKKEKSKKEKKSKGMVLPSNKVTAGHAQKMRLAKFGEKSADDLACIFRNKNVAAALTRPVVAPVAAVSETSSDVASIEVNTEKKSKKDKKKKRSREGKLEEQDNVTNEGSTESRVREEKKRKKNKEAKKSKE
jgi:Pin2-interacting protein X1